ncbi:hypothetical protein SESBI_47309 [Sesbania bispinosa]|nr:hypothetical protein SESBI_47309 [Sesbania bispinosa]
MAPNTTGVVPPVLIVKVSSSPITSNQPPLASVEGLKESIWSANSRSLVKIFLTEIPSFTPQGINRQGKASRFLRFVEIKFMVLRGSRLQATLTLQEDFSIIDLRGVEAPKRTQVLPVGVNLSIKGSLESKHLLQTFSSRENSSPAISSFLQHSFHLSRHKHSGSDPMKKFIREFYSDLKMVYVGQLCLSWEFLQWEYERALELWESDHYRLQRYNGIAGEFQQFQCTFKLCGGPYNNKSFSLSPLSAEDNTKEERKFRTSNADKDAITSDILVEILEESMRTIWRFIRADKYASSLNHKGPRETQLDLQDPAYSELVEIQAELQKGTEEEARDILSKVQYCDF